MGSRPGVFEAQGGGQCGWGGGGTGGQQVRSEKWSVASRGRRAGACENFACILCRLGNLWRLEDWNALEGPLWLLH